MSEFHLGFSIDTTALKQASADAAKAAADIGKLGDAETKLGDSAGKAAEGQKRVSDAIKDAEVNAQRYIRSLEMEARATKDFERSQDALNKALAQGKVGAQAHATMMRQLEQSYRQAQKEAKDFRDAVDHGGGGVGGLASRLQQASGAITTTTMDLAQLRGALSGGPTGLAGGLEATGGLLSRFAGGLGAVGAAAAVGTVAIAALGFAYFEGMKALGEYEDKMARLEGRLKNSLGSLGAARQAIDALYQSTQKTGLGFDAAADAFARIARNNDAIGLTQKEMLQMVDTVQKLGAVSGASAGEMSSGMIQFGQALASGRLQGDELRSIMENFPALAKAIADNFETADGRIGVAIGTLRRMGSEGELVSGKIADAVLRAQKQTEEQYKNMPQTMEQANNRIADSFSRMMTNMGRAFQASEFVRGIYDFLNNVATSVNTIFERLITAKNQSRIAEIDEQLKSGKKVVEGGLGVTLGGPFGLLPTYRPTRETPLTATQRAQLEAERAGLTASMPMTAAQQAAADARKKLEATAMSSDTLIQQNLGAEGQRRKLQTDLRSVQEANAARQQLLAQGGKPEDLEALRKDIDDGNKAAAELERKIKAVGAKSSRGGGKGRSSLEALLDTVEDTVEAIASGGGGGGTSIYGEAISARRSDASSNRAQSLERYVSALTSKAVQAANVSVRELERQTEAQKAMGATVGASADVLKEAEIAQAAADFRYQHFGKVTTPEVEQAVAAYTKALRENKTQIDLNKQAQEALDATKRAALAWEKTNTGGDPREQRRLGFENSLNEELSAKFGDPDKLTEGQRLQRDLFVQGRRSEFLAGEVDQQNKITTAQDKQVKAAEARLRIANLTTDEYEVQMRLLQMGARLEAEGYKPGEAFYESTMAREETNARSEQRLEKDADYRRKFVQQWERSAQQVENLFSNSFDTIFTEGVEKAGSIFAKGLGQIVKDLSAMMIYELAYRPLAEMATNFVKQFGQNIAGMIFGGGGMPSIGSANASVSASLGPSSFIGPRSAKGSYFDGGRYEFAPFAMGGVFTNQVVDQPTMFAFAKGGALGLMGEAGPEAIMPLKRDPNGRLGVAAQNMGGDVQVVVNDMRSSAGAEPVETRSSRGPDGRRVISVMIRDEMRRQLRSGDLDRDMASNYGNSRTLARK